MDKSRQLHHSSVLGVHQLGKSFAVVADPGVDFDVPFSLDLYACVLHPFHVKIPEEFAGTGRRVNSFCIFQRCEFLFSDGFKESKLITFFKNIKVKKLKLDPIIVVGLGALASYWIVRFDFLLGQMILPVYLLHNRRRISDLINKRSCHQHCGSVSMTIHKVSFLAFLFHYLFWNLTVFTHIHFSICDHMYPNFFLWIGFLHVR